jgi:hypothetical protein
MLRASLLTMAFSSSCMAFLGDWNVWTQSTDARMAVVNGKTAWVATGGGVMEWDLDGGSSRMHTRKTGLPTIDIASIVLDSNKTVWAIGSDGRMAYWSVGATEWRTKDSYSTQNWTFLQRAAQCWKGPNHPGFLILGTNKGLSLYSLKSKAAEDFASTFGKITGEVQAVMVTPGLTKTGSKPDPDTLWLALSVGMVHATPNWDSVGLAGHYLADDSKWTVDTIVSADNKVVRTLVRDETGVHLGAAATQWSNASGNLSIQSGSVINKAWPQPLSLVGSVHATPYGQDLLVSTTTQGAVLLSKIGDVKSTAPEGNYPDVIPYNVRIGRDGTLLALSGNKGNRLLSHSPSRDWVTDTLRYSTSAGMVMADWDYTYVPVFLPRLGLEVGPQGEIVVPTWGEWVPQNGFPTSGVFVSSQNGKWENYAYGPSDTCLGYPTDKDGPAYPGATYAAHSNGTTGTWISAIDHSHLGRMLFLPAGGKTRPTCLDIPIQNAGGMQIEAFDQIQVGDTLWVASKGALIRVISPRPSYPPPVATQVEFLTTSSTSELNLYRLAQTTFEGKIWIVGAASGRLILYPADGEVGGKKVSNLFTSDVDAPSLNQKYVALAIDAQGQIWAAGDKGIDIVKLVSPDTDSSPPVFQPLPRITTADGLPENFIRDLSLQASTGKALIATPHSVSLWTSPYRPVPAKLAKSSVHVSPNPVRLRNTVNPDKYLYVDGATIDSRFDLLAADGTLVMHLDASKMVGGQFQIPLPAPSKLRPGLYFWSLKDSHGSVRGPLLIAE